MRHYMRDRRAAKPWRGRVALGVLALAVLVVGTYFFVQALGGFEKVIALLGQGQALGQRMRDLVEQTGTWAPLAYVAAKALIFIFVPWLGYPLNVAAGALFGLFWGVVLTAIGDTLGGCILFLLSRWAGRPTVARLVGENRMARVDTVSVAGVSCSSFGWWSPSRSTWSASPLAWFPSCPSGNS
jgi:uncharacterized membrane protein YdjX (TVP38/TMEM64 family)